MKISSKVNSSPFLCKKNEQKITIELKIKSFKGSNQHELKKKKIIVLLRLLNAMWAINFHISKFA